MTSPATTWLLLVSNLPGHNPTLRMRTWRALKAAGAGLLRDGAYLLPDVGSARKVLEEQGAVFFAKGTGWRPAVLDHLRKRLAIPAEKFVIAMKDCGNTVSSTIPIALKHAAASGQLRKDSLVMLVGFGVGYSWCTTRVVWK